MSSDKTTPAATLALTLSLIALAPPAGAADISCNGLVPPGAKMICPGFEPNWAVELLCGSEGMSSNFVDAFSGDDVVVTPGDVTFISENPWGFSTSHGVSGLISHTPGACQDESDRTFDFTLTTNAVPGYTGQVAPICCRLE